MSPWTLGGAAAALAMTLGLVATPARAATDPLSRAAEVNNMSRTAVERLLATDPTAKLGVGQRIVYSEEAPESAPPVAEATAPAYPLEQTFLLHSRPGAQRTLYLDVDGYDVSATVWGNKGVSLPNTVGGYDSNGSPAFSDTEKAAVQDMWRLVAEDFAAFDVDVTTQDPGVAALDRSSAADQVYGATALITSDTLWNTNLCSCAGKAYIGVYDHFSSGIQNHLYYQPAIVLADVLYNDAFYIAQAASHELGHNLGLNHDGVTGGSAYYSGVAGGLWAPIMGSSYDNPVSTWSKGEYAGANNTQDDFAVMVDNGLPLRTDEAGSDIASAAPVTGQQFGVVSAADKDVYTFTTSCIGNVTASVSTAAYGADLDVQVRLLDSQGAVLASAAPTTARVSGEAASGLGASFSSSLSEGTYAVEVDGVGTGTWAGGGYSDYASAGAYTLTLTGCLGQGTPPDPTPDPDPTPNPTPDPQPTPDPTPTLTAPGAPTAVTARSGSRGGRLTAKVSWQAPASGGTVAHYVVVAEQVRHGAVVKTRSPGDLPADSRALTLQLGKGKWRFVVTAVNAAGASGPAPTHLVRAR